MRHAKDNMAQDCRNPNHDYDSALAAVGGSESEVSGMTPSHPQISQIHADETSGHCMNRRNLRTEDFVSVNFP